MNLEKNLNTLCSFIAVSGVVLDTAQFKNLKNVSNSQCKCWKLGNFYVILVESYF